MACCPVFFRCLAVALLAGAVVVTAVSCSSSATTEKAPTSNKANPSKEPDKGPKEPAPDMRDK